MFRATALTTAVVDAPPIPDFARWWRVLHDPQLDRLIDMAIARNPDIEIALTRVQEARSQQIVMLGGMLPTVGGSGTIATGTGIDLSRARRSGDHGGRRPPRLQAD
jgi:outer membrane protein TolC